ncbi:MAG TPA: hypothetical protein VLG76_07120 [Rhabdochlamydiaceae bacterium]|nr:hypothetical protein [Rhabdochlamydiaceae bacterium]
MTGKFNPILDVNSQPYYENNMGFLDQASIGTNSIHSAQQAITDPFEIDLPLLLDGIAEFPPSVSILPVAESVREQIAQPFFGVAHDALVSTQDMTAVAQSSAISSQIQPSFASSSISPTSENLQAKTKKASKRKQPEAPKSTKGKREKSTSSKSVRARPIPTEDKDPLPRLMIAFQNNTAHSTLPTLIRNLRLNVRFPSLEGLARRYLYAIGERFLGEKPDGTISDEALKEIYDKYNIKRSRIDRLLPTARQNKAPFLEYLGIKQEKQSTIPAAVTQSSAAGVAKETAPDPLLPAIQEFQSCNGECTIKSLLNGGKEFSETTLWSYINAIAEYHFYKEINGSDVALNKACKNTRSVSRTRLQTLLSETENYTQVYLNHFQKTQKRKHRKKPK